MVEKLKKAFEGKSNCERLAIIAPVIEKLLKEFSRGEHSREIVADFYEGLIIAHEKEAFLEPEMDCPDCFDFSYYLRLLSDVIDNDMSINSLVECLQIWDKTKASDAIINNMYGAADNFELSPSQTRMEDSLYLDFNIYDIIEKNQVFSLVGNLDIVYSPIHLEEVYRMKDEAFIKNRMDSITKITGNTIILQMGEVFEVYKEDPKKSYERVLSNPSLSEALEHERTIKANDRDIFFKDIYEKYSQKLHFMENVFQEVSWEEISQMLRFGGCHLGKDDFKLPKEKATSDQLLKRIYSLYNMMDNLSYYRDKNKNNGRTFRSAVYDIEHLRYAANCRYFITKDRNLASRAKQIYGFMGLTTVVVPVDSLESLKSFFEGLRK